MLPLRPGLSRQLSAASMQIPMASCPLKQTNEIDWIAPLKHYIRSSYGDDPERYAEECAQLNRLRQDMRGAGKDSAAGRDLLYRYYGQLELLDLRFPVDENHIKISFTWFDAFTHKPTSQYSLAYEKASIIFNISAVLSSHAAHQNRNEETGLKMAYHSFQASAGMFTYINENFLHAPSTDLSRETVRTLISIMLAQGQEVFIEKQVVDRKKPGLLAKLCSQAASLYAQAVEGVQDNVSRAIFERVWLLLVQIKQHHMASLAQYYQAIADYEANSYGQAIYRLQAAVSASKEASRLANAFPGSVPSNSNLSSETGTILADMTKKHMATCSELVAEYTRDNDMIYHQPVPNESTLPSIPKLPAAKAIPVSELYQGQDIQRIIGPDIFQRIVPMSVTESASLYDEEKAKMLRAENDRVEQADGELAGSLDYLKLPGSLNILKGGMDQDSMGVDDEFRDWCGDLAGHESFGPTFERVRDDKQHILSVLEGCTKQLDMEESVCEKMRSKYGPDWTQQPSSRLTSTLRTDAKSYRSAVEEASTSDAQLFSTFRQYESDFDEMRSAGETDEADVLYQRAMIKVGAGKKNVASPALSGHGEGNLLDDDYDDGRQSVQEQIEKMEELMRKLQLVKRERQQVLKDLKEKVHDDDISNVLILNKKAISSQEQQLFKTELEKFRPHQTRILQANHKQKSLMNEMTRSYGELLQDKRVRAEQNKYESYSRQRNSVLQRYRKIFQAYTDLTAGIERAQEFYREMKETAESLEKNVQGFVENRRSEGGQLLSSIEERKGSGADREQVRLKDLMERMSVNPNNSASPPPPPPPQQPQSISPAQNSRPDTGFGDARPGGHRPPPLSQQSSWGAHAPYNPAASPPMTPRYQPNGMQSPAYAGFGATAQPQPLNGSYNQHQSMYNPAGYGAMSPPAHQQYFSPPPGSAQASTFGGQPFATPYGGQLQPPPSAFGHQPHTPYGGQPQPQQQQMPPGWQPPPPPPGPPPAQTQGSADPWAGLNAWK
ncbi:BRO1-domain-containing protein [Polychaeton citri CBS 116435]|uniref:BRO domain-containing protein 1 n=1 Tax=Polychaeton citri CBS 116435 TaxID=1314669 RepID=A0A9P4UM87_9PEZI|nr:BRO1-domain-containing protein [Polychaeton citri CBS 116435]